MNIQISIWDILPNSVRKAPSLKEQYLEFSRYLQKCEDQVEEMCKRCINHEVCEGTGCQPKKDLLDMCYSMRLKPDKSKYGEE